MIDNRDQQQLNGSESSLLSLLRNPKTVSAYTYWNRSDYSSDNVWHKKEGGGQYMLPKQATTINTGFAASELIYRNTGRREKRKGALTTNKLDR